MDYNDQIQEGIRLINAGEYQASIDLAATIQKNQPDTADGFHLEAIGKQHLYQWEESIKALNKAIELAPYDAGLYSLRAFAKMSTEDFVGAEKDLHEAIKLENFEPAHRNLVILYILRDQSQKAIDYLLERLKTNPKDVDNWVLMGDLMQRVGMDDKAQSYYEQARKLDPENPNIASEKK